MFKVPDICGEEDITHVVEPISGEDRNQLYGLLDREEHPHDTIADIKAFPRDTQMARISPDMIFSYCDAPAFTTQVSFHGTILGQHGFVLTSEVMYQVESQFDRRCMHVIYDPGKNLAMNLRLLAYSSQNGLALARADIPGDVEMLPIPITARDYVVGEACLSTGFRDIPSGVGGSIFDAGQMELGDNFEPVFAPTTAPSVELGQFFENRMAVCPATVGEDEDREELSHMYGHPCKALPLGTPIVSSANTLVGLNVLPFDEYNIIAQPSTIVRFIQGYLDQLS